MEPAKSRLCVSRTQMPSERCQTRRRSRFARDERHTQLIVTDIAGALLAGKSVRREQREQVFRRVARQPHLVAQAAVIGKERSAQAAERRDQKSAAPGKIEERLHVGNGVKVGRQYVGENKLSLVFQFLVPEVEQILEFAVLQILQEGIGDDEIERGVTDHLEFPVGFDYDVAIARKPPA